MNSINSNDIKKTIRDALKSVGLKRDDTVLVHSDSTVIREISNLTWGESLDLLKECFLNIIGNNGTLVVPTFNWDFCKGQTYDHDETRSQVGMFSNNILFDDHSLRSLHPIYSFAAIGPSAISLFADISNSSFGENSVFHRLYQQNAKMVLFNSYADFAFVHYVEQVKKVKYRYLKYFTGSLRRNGITEVDTFDFNVRKKSDTTKFNNKGLHKLLIDSKKMKKTMIDDKYPVCQVNCRDFNDLLLDKLNHIPGFLRVDG